jgi:hypothetical protein
LLKQGRSDRPCFLSPDPTTLDIGGMMHPRGINAVCWIWGQATVQYGVMVKYHQWFTRDRLANGSESHNPEGRVYNLEYENQRDGARPLCLETKKVYDKIVTLKWKATLYTTLVIRPFNPRCVKQRGFSFCNNLNYFFYIWVGAGLGLPTPTLIHEICQITNCYEMLQE